jgi:hypothetical protein
VSIMSIPSISTPVILVVSPSCSSSSSSDPEVMSPFY